MTRGRVSWQISDAGLVLGSALISFQRFVRPLDGVMEEVPPSCGVLPVAEVGGIYLLPLAAEEAFWIGILLQDIVQDEFVLSILGSKSNLVASERYARSGAFVLGGIPLAVGLGAFCRESISRLKACCASICAEVVPITREQYFEQTGRKPPPPLDANAAYKGWRLP